MSREFAIIIRPSTRYGPRYMSGRSNVDIVFGDLAQAYQELSAERHSPRRVRTAFARFLSLSQALTYAMRKEFRYFTGEEWTPKTFSWTPATAVCKKLRNIDQHGVPVRVKVRQRIYLSVVAGSPEELTMEFTWSLDDPFSELPPEGLDVAVAYPDTGPITARCILPKRVEYDFVVWSESDDARKALSGCKSDDLHDIAGEAMECYKRYYEFYTTELGRHHGS